MKSNTSKYTLALLALSCAASHAATLTVNGITGTSGTSGSNSFAREDLRVGTAATAEFRAGSFALTGSITTGTGAHTLSLNMAFCAEMAEPIGNGDVVNYDIVALSQVSGGSAPNGAGLDAAQSANIPDGGIGALRAARVEYLFQHYYVGTSQASWTYGGTATVGDAYGFQLALWELTHDTDMTLTVPADTTGYQGLGGTWSTTSGTTAKNQRVYEHAQTMLAAVSAANVPTGYKSTTWEVIGLSNNGANQSTAGKQDIITAVAIPEPSAMVLGLSGCLLLARRRRTSAR